VNFYSLVTVRSKIGVMWLRDAKLASKNLIAYSSLPMGNTEH
jgi:hypothetical protein